jgi:replicative DNA helicase
MSKTTQDTNSSKNNGSLPIRHVSVTANKFVKSVYGRMEGKIKSLRTGFLKFDRALLDGIEWYRILTIAGLSGSGKSITLEAIKRNLFEANPDQDFLVLSFSLEMPSPDEMARNVSGKLKKDLKWIYSIDGKLTEEGVKMIEREVAKITKLPIYIVEISGQVEQIRNTILEFTRLRNLKQTKQGLVVTIDHTLLTKGRTGQNQKSIVDELCNMFVELKKQYVEMEIPIIIIMLSQLNRDIKDKNRVTNPMLHYPTDNDIFASSSVYHASDYVLVTHKPSRVSGIDNYYGPGAGTQYPYGYPVYNPENPEEAMVYWHIIKNRWGSEGIIMMVDEFQYASIREYEPIQDGT